MLKIDKNYTMLLLIAFLVFINFFSYISITPLYLTEIGAGDFHIGLQNTLFFLFAVLFRSYFGPMADAKGRKLPLLIGIFAFATASLMFCFVNSVVGVILVRIYQSIGLAAFFSTGGSLVGDLSPPGKVGTYMSGYRFVNTLAVLVGPYFAIAIINHFGYQGWFLTGTLVGGAALVVALNMDYPAYEKDRTDASLPEKIKRVFSMKTVPVVFYATSLCTFMLGSLQTFSPLYINQVTDIANPGSYFVFFGIAGLCANFTAGFLTDRLGSDRITWPFLITLGLGVLLLVWLPTYSYIFALSGLIAGFGLNGAITALFTWLVQTVDPSERATALSVQESVIDVSIAVGSLVFGSIVGFIGFGWSFFAIGFFTMLAAIVTQLKVGTVRRKKVG